MLLDLIIDRNNKKLMLKRQEMSSELYNKSKTFELDFLELLIFKTVSEYISYKKKAKLELRKYQAEPKRDLDAPDKISSEQILDKLKRKYILKKDKKEDVTKEYESIINKLKKDKKEKKLSAENTKANLTDKFEVVKITEMFCLELLLYDVIIVYLKSPNKI